MSPSEGILYQTPDILASPPHPHGRNENPPAPGVLIDKYKNPSREDKNTPSEGILDQTPDILSFATRKKPWYSCVHQNGQTDREECDLI